MTTIADRLQTAHYRIAQAAQRCGRNAQQIHLLAVSKTKPITDIVTAYQAGQRCFGENYVQEGVEKITTLQAEFIDIEWHFIGPLQSNKTHLVAQHFDWIHTVAREKIAQRLNDQRPPDSAPLNVCLQINISKEENKSGLEPEQMLGLAQFVASQPNLLLRGLMAIPAATTDPLLQQQAFTQLATLFHQLKLHHPSIDTLSMGMSGDLDNAIECGSTMVRIGSAIFGERRPHHD